MLSGSRTSKAVEDTKAKLDKAVEKYIDIHSNKKLQQEMEDLQIEEASLRYHVNPLRTIRFLKNGFSTIKIVIQF